MKNFISWLKTEESGQGMVEYGLIIAGVAVVVLAAIFLLGGKVRDLFNNVASSITTTVPTT